MFKVVLLALIVCGMGSQHTDAGLIVNGSFESPGFNGAHPAGWSLITNSYGSWSGTNELPTAGNFVLHPGANYHAGGRYQDITTTIGQSYDFSFWGTGFINGNALQYGIAQVGTPGTSPTSLAQNNNAEYVDFIWEVPRHTTVGDWRKFEFTFTPTTTTTRVSFQNIYAGPGRNAINVDLISVTPGVAAVPEPSSIAVFGTGLLGLLGWRRRRAVTV